MQLHVRMASRDPDEAHRAATPLELFLDLTFVVAVAQASAAFHHGLVTGHAGDVLAVFPLAFFAIWWAWMNFTWFASAYDTDDAVYRVAVFVQMAGVLVLAAGIPDSIDHQDLGVATFGYVIMRLAMVAQWLRAAAAHPEGRRAARRYAGGITVVQVGWVARALLVSGLALPVSALLVAAELLVPVWAEREGRTGWHPHHIAERYGLFTIIVLGEVVLSASLGVQTALDANSPLGDLLPIIVGGFLLVCSMWWLYFDMPGALVVGRARRAFEQRLAAPFVWGYGHYVVFASAALTGAGLAVAVDQATDRSTLSDLAAAFAVTGPVAAYVLSVWLLHYRHKPPSPLHRFGVPVAASLVLASSVTPEPVLVAGGVLAGLIAASVAQR